MPVLLADHHPGYRPALLEAQRPYSSQPNPIRRQPINIPYHNIHQQQQQQQQ